MQQMSGEAYSSHSVTRPRRAFSELTFQVATRRVISARRRTGDSASQAVSPPTDARPCPLPPRPDSRPSENLELEHLARHDLAPEPGLVDPAEERQPAGEAVVGEDDDGAELGERLHHQHPGEGRPAGEVAGEERLRARQLPAAPRRRGGHELGDLVHEEKRSPVRQHVLRPRKRRDPNRHPIVHRPRAYREREPSGRPRRGHPPRALAARAFVSRRLRTCHCRTSPRRRAPRARRRSTRRRSG